MKSRDVGALGTQPQVNLLPPEIRSARGLRVVQRLLGLAMLVILGLVGLGYLYAANEASQAESELEDARAETARLLAERATYSPVTAVLDQVTATDIARRLALASEIEVGPYLGAITAVTPPGVTIESVTYTGSSPMVLPPVRASALVAPGVGEIVISGRAPFMPDTVIWATALNGIPGLRDAAVDATQVAGTADVTYHIVTATVTLDESALADRFGPLTDPGALGVGEESDDSDEEGDA